jgi:hypothetical protein
MYDAAKKCSRRQHHCLAPDLFTIRQHNAGNPSGFIDQIGCFTFNDSEIRA